MRTTQATLRRARRHSRVLAVQRTAWILLGLLGVSAILISLGDQETGTMPSPSNFGPAGAAAFAQLLRSAGYQVEDSTSTMDDLQNVDLAIAFTIQGGDTLSLTGDSDSRTEQAKKLLTDYSKGGGNVLYLPLAGDFQTASKNASETPFSKLLGPMDHGIVTVQTSAASVPPTGVTSLPLGKTGNGTPLGYLAVSGKGHELNAIDGLIATNRMIDRKDNAALLMRFVSMLCPPGGRIVFKEASWGNASDPSLMEAIGPWAIAGWRQLIFLGFVVAFTLGRRFGIGRTYSLPQPSSREFVDAVANLYEQSDASARAIDVSVQRAERILKRRLKLSPEIASAEFRPMLPHSLVSAMYGWKSAILRPDPLTLIRRMDRELSDFLKTL